MNKKPNQQAAEKRKREEAMLNFIAGQKRLPADIVSVLDEVLPGADTRIWIGTGDAGEPNE